MKNIAIIGAGLMTKPMVDYFIDKIGYKVIMLNRTLSKAEKIIGNRPLGKAMEWNNNNTEILDDVIKEADIVISMVPKPLHIKVAKSCLKYKKNMITASYEIPELMALRDDVENQGILILNELGEVPGMDHFGTQMLLEEIKNDGGRIISLNSYGSGIPAFESNNNPMGYKFSWDPRTVFVAAQTAGAYLVKGEKIYIPGDKLFEKFWFVEIDGLGTFETYPNKDVEKYIKPFDLDDDVSFYRGLLRYSGYCNNMRYMEALGLFDNENLNDLKNKTFRQFTASLIDSDSSPNIEESLAKYLKIESNSDIIHRLKWLGLFDDTLIPLDKGTNLDVLLNRMLEKMQYAPGEKDMIILHIEIIAEFDNGKKEKRIATMIVKGNPEGETAMSRAVALPTAIAARLVVDGVIKATGLKMPPNLPELYKPALEELKKFGFEFSTKRIKLD
ncbi:MAG: saccharopine dehydrogenase NADP-binding domain-containing protein [Candidatus Cloacimonetes bacterium]|nr:saccharopine dehydrogenase NADP-binding domain-containing protein [Candidatus Cloacimonadota bacterium]